MGKKRVSESFQIEGMSDYEKQRLKKLEYNATRMEAAGLNSIANKFLWSRFNGLSKQPVDVDMSEDDDEYVCSEEDENEKNPNQALSTQKDQSKHGKKQALSQTLSMAEFAKLRSGKVQKKKDHPPLSQLHSSQDLQKKKKIQQEERQQKKTIKYCSPGSITSFMKLRQRQQEEKQQVNLLDDRQAVEESNEVLLMGQGGNLAIEVSRDENHLNGNEENMMADANEVACAQNVNVASEITTLPVDNLKKHRGPTKMIEVHRRNHSEREIIILNSKGQPIGPTKASVTKLSRFLGTVAKFPHLVPLKCISWKYVHTKDKIWDYVMEKYIIPEEGRTWVMDTICALWRVHKSRLKKKHYDAFETDEERLLNRPDYIPIQQFEELLEFWNSDVAKERSETNKRSRELREDVHTMGPSSYALLRHELQQKDPNKEPPSQAKIYKESRKRVVGRTYKTKNEKSTSNIDQMEALQSQYDQNGEGNNSKDPYYEVMASDKKNLRLHFHGRSVTKSKLKEQNKVNMPNYILPPEFLQSIKVDLVQQVAPDLVSLLVSKIEAANPGVQLTIPDFANIACGDASNSKPSNASVHPLGSEKFIQADSNHENGHEIGKI